MEPGEPAEEGKRHRRQNYDNHIHLDEIDVDDIVEGTTSSVLRRFIRTDSMELTNDPRFFQSNVIDKRLHAISKLLLVSSLILGTSMSQLFSLRKDMNFDGSKWCALTGCAQLVGFSMQVIVSFHCLIAVYTMSHQLYHIYRLMTSGPTGIELAGMYYLSPAIALWRHTAVKALLSGLWLFVLASGAILFVKFIKDGDALPQCFLTLKASHEPHDVIIMNPQDITGILPNVTTDSMLLQPLRKQMPNKSINLGPMGPMDVHLMFACAVLGAFIVCTLVLCHIRGVHKKAFAKHYTMLTEGGHSTSDVSGRFYSMSHRSTSSPMLDSRV